jgi:hypothetical protein
LFFLEVSPMKFSIKGVLVGGLVDVSASVLFGLPFAVYEMTKVDLSHTPSAQASTALAQAIRANVPLYVGQLLVGVACSVLGGYVAAWLAKHDELLNGALSCIPSVALGIYGMASGKDSNSMWAQTLLILACPALALAGGDLMRRQRKGRALAT